MFAYQNVILRASNETSHGMLSTLKSFDIKLFSKLHLTSGGLLVLAYSKTIIKNSNPFEYIVPLYKMKHHSLFHLVEIGRDVLAALYIYKVIFFHLNGA